MKRKRLDRSERGKLLRLGRAAAAFEKWFSGIGLDHIPNAVYHDRGGYDLVETLRKAIEDAEELLTQNLKGDDDAR